MLDSEAARPRQTGVCSGIDRLSAQETGSATPFDLLPGQPTVDSEFNGWQNW
jgi:hypothetical protein